MPTRTIETEDHGYGGEDYGKCVCLSFPAHELDLIDDMDFLAAMECAASRSHYIRLLIRREKRKWKNQEEQQVKLAAMWGNK